MKILLAGGYAPSLLTFRAPLIKACVDAGCTIVATAAEENEEVGTTLLRWGASYRSVRVARAGLNPLADRTYCSALARMIDDEQPAAVLAYTHKPVIYSALAAARSRTKPRVYAMITGLGFAFIDGGGFKKWIAGTVLRFLYRRAAKHFSGVIFQNPDDQALFRKLRLVRPETPQIIVRGSGIDLAEFAFAPLGEPGNAETLKSETLKRDQSLSDDRNADTLKASRETKSEIERGGQKSDVSFSASQHVSISSPCVRFLLIARLLGDKGIREYVASARILKREFPAAEFHLIGPTDPNPAAIKLEEVEGWQREQVIVYHGRQNDVRPFLRDCTVYVLPSYREGTPRTVLEAMATGRPVITTDAPGCRETLFDPGMPDADQVRTGRNGFLVPVKSVEALATAMRRFIDDPSLAERMGAEGRRLAEEYYDVHKVNQQILEFMGLAAKTA